MASNGPPPPKKLKTTQNNDTYEDDSVDSDESDTDDVSNHFEIRQISRNVVRKYGMEEFNFEARLRSSRVRNRRLSEIMDSLRAMFQEIIDRAGRHYDADDRIRLHVEHSGLEVPFVIHLQPRHNVTADTVLER